MSREIRAGELTAWRCWRVLGDGTYRSMIYPTVWTLGVPIVGDTRQGGAGVHAWKTKEAALAYGGGGGGDQIAIGTVDLWGEVVEHEWGYRAQYGKIREIVEVIDHQRPVPPAVIRSSYASVAAMPIQGLGYQGTASKPESDLRSAFVLLTAAAAMLLLMVALTQVHGPPPHAISAAAVAAKCVDVADLKKPGQITDISFKAQHDESGTRGRTYTIPDTWWLRVCNFDNKWCEVLKITHAPWRWQTEGASVTLHWEKTCYGDDSWKWRVTGISPPPAVTTVP